MYLSHLKKANVYLLLLAPAFALSLKGWSNFVLFLLFLLCLVDWLFSRKEQLIKISSLNVMDKLLLSSLAIPFFVIAFTQIIRADFYISLYDAPLRLLIATLICIYFLQSARQNLNKAILIEYGILLSILSSYIYILAFPEYPQVWGGRFATRHADPNAFGVYITAFTFVYAALSLNYSSKLSRPSLLLLILSLGIFLIIGSQTRGAWISIPFAAIPIFLYLHSQSPMRTKLILIGGFFSLVVAYIINDNLNTRVSSIFLEAYQWFTNRELRDTSIGIRFSIWVIAWEIGMQKFLTGYGTFGFIDTITSEKYTSVYSPIVIETLIKAGPHNEYLANFLRSGITGLIGTLCLIFIPLGIFYRLYKKTLYIGKDARYALAGLCFCICLAICALSIEIFTLKYTTSLYGLTVVGLYILSRKQIYE